MEFLLSALLGLGLAASCGFRVFVPPLIVSLGAQLGWLEVTETFAWMGSYPALVLFTTATLLEVAGHYIPFVDNALNAASSPLAVVAGVVVSASVFTEMNPLVLWTMAIVAGGGMAGVSKAANGSTRLLSTVTTAGMGNPIWTTIETVGAFLLSLLSIWLPLLAGLVLVVLFFFGWRLMRR